MDADVLEGIQARYLDCLQVNLAVLADWHHGAGRHLRLGTRPGFRPTFGAGLPTVEAGLSERIDQARCLLGLSAVDSRHCHSGNALVGLLADGETRYVVADAYYLPWVPYCGQQHTGHSFLATLDAAGLRIVDAYHNDTPWGTARPGIRRLPAAELVSALAGTTATVIRFAPVAGSGTDIGSVDMEPPDPHTVSRYIAAYQTWDDRRAALDGLVLETWLLARERGLYAARAGGPVLAAHAAAWEALARKTYVGARRVALGRPEPGGIFDDLEALLRAEENLEAAADASAPTRPSPGTATGRGLSNATEERVSHAVRNAVSAVMGIPADRLTATASADELPEISSFQLVRILERIERELDLVIPAEHLAPEDLRDVPSLRELFVRCLRGQLTHA